MVDEARLFEDQPDCAVIFSWHIADELAPKLRAKGFRGQLITPLPVAAGAVTSPYRNLNSAIVIVPFS